MLNSRVIIAGCLLGGTLVLSARPVSAEANGPGAIFTTDGECTGTNVNLFGSKDAVYLDGGPAHEGAAGLADGDYYVRVTEPDGDLLGTSVGSGNDTPVHVTDGEFAVCYQLSAILIRASDGFPGFDTTTNTGGEYKVEISPDSDFTPKKSDNFKVEEEDEENPPEEVPELCLVKFYDANVNGVFDEDEVEIIGWQMTLNGGIYEDDVRYTHECVIAEPGEYSATESESTVHEWIATTPTTQTATIEEGGPSIDLEFGNVCLGAGGGKTLGYWSNKNGQATMNDGGTSVPELAMLTALNLRTAGGGIFDPTSYAQFRTWILGATATNMAYMLSAQLAAMELNVEAGNVDKNAIVYAGTCGNVNDGQFITIADLMAAANTELGLHGNTTSPHASRALQECLKNALDQANNNLNFVQPEPCPFAFD